MKLPVNDRSSSQNYIISLLFLSKILRAAILDICDVTGKFAFYSQIKDEYIYESPLENIHKILAISLDL